MAIRKRNPDAMCGTCAYCYPQKESTTRGYCQKNAPHGDDSEWPADVAIKGWCGQHPEFWVEIKPFLGPLPSPKNPMACAICGGTDATSRCFQSIMGEDDYEDGGIAEAFGGTQNSIQQRLYMPCREVINIAIRRRMYEESIKDWSGQDHHHD